MTYAQPPPPPFQHQPYSNPPPSSTHLPPPAHYRHYSDSDQPRLSNDNIFDSSPGATTSGYDPSLPTVPAGQLLPPQPLAPVAPPYDNNGGLLPSAAAQLGPPGNYRRSSHESHRSHQSHHSHHSRPRSSSGRSHHSQTKDDKRPTLGDTLMLIWDSVRGTRKPK